MKKNPSQPRIIYNDDSCSMRMVPPPHNEQRIHTAVDYLKDSQVDILCYCLGEQSCAYAYLSDKVESGLTVALEALGKKKSTTAVESVGFPEQNNLMLQLYKQGIDYLPILIERTRQHGIEFFASFRMNDTHLRSDPCGFLAPKFWREHQQYRLWSLTDAQNYYNAALDYSFPEVRANYFAMVEEVAQKYDVDGIELDFGRKPYLFQVGQGWGKRKIMADFIRSIRQMLDETGKRKGKKIRFMLRTVFNQDLLRDAGMDIKDWLRKGYLDFLVMANWSSNTTNDNNVTLEPWLSLCREHQVGFYPSIEGQPAVNNKENVPALIPNPLLPAYNNLLPAAPEQVTPEEEQKMAGCLRATAQNYLGQGAPGVYMFNHPCYMYEGDNVRFSDKKRFEALASYLFELGAQKTLAGKAKRYLFWPQTPICVDSGRPMEFHQTLRFNIFDPAVKNKNAAAVISFRQVAEKHTHCGETYRQNPIVPPGWVHYYLNGQPIGENLIARSPRPKGRIPSQFLLQKHELITLTVPATRLQFGPNQLAFHIPRYPQARDPFVHIHELAVDL